MCVSSVSVSVFACVGSMYVLFACVCVLCVHEYIYNIDIYICVCVWTSSTHATYRSIYQSLRQIVEQLPLEREDSNLDHNTGVKNINTVSIHDLSLSFTHTHTHTHAHTHTHTHTPWPGLVLQHIVLFVVCAGTTKQRKSFRDAVGPYDTLIWLGSSPNHRPSKHTNSPCVVAD